jgi:hypothetical protein
LALAESLTQSLVSAFHPFLPVAQWQLSTQSGHKGVGERDLVAEDANREAIDEAELQAQRLLRMSNVRRVATLAVR